MKQEDPSMRRCTRSWPRRWLRSSTLSWREENFDGDSKSARREQEKARRARETKIEGRGSSRARKARDVDDATRRDTGLETQSVRCETSRRKGQTDCQSAEEDATLTAQGVDEMQADDLCHTAAEVHPEEAEVEDVTAPRSERVTLQWSEKMRMRRAAWQSRRSQEK